MATGSGATIIVPTRNSASTIEACLESILTTIPESRRQVIVVDNGSTDDTLSRVGRFPVRVERIPRSFVSRSRNAGVRLATFDVVAFVDSDCQVQAGWLDAILDVLSDPAVGIAGCRYEIRSQPSWVESAWDRAHRRASTAERADVRYVPGGNLAMRRETFLAIGGFDEAIETGEDMDLCARVAAHGSRIVEARPIRCVHLGEPRTLAAVFHRNRWHGRGTRLRYADGRVGAIMLSTIVFAVTALVSVGGLLSAALVRGWPPASVLGVAVVPAVYALKYAKRPRAEHTAQLFLIYSAYFLGRSCALPAVLLRSWRSDWISRLPGLNLRSKAE